MKFPLEAYWCLPRNISFELIGVWGVARQTDLKLNVDLCQKSSFNTNDCLPMETIRSSLRSSGTLAMHLLVSNGYFNGLNFTEPGVRTIHSNLIRTNLDTWARVVYWFKNIEYTTDEGWILESLRSKAYTYIDFIDKENLLKRME